MNATSVILSQAMGSELWARPGRTSGNLSVNQSLKFTKQSQFPQYFPGLLPFHDAKLNDFNSFDCLSAQYPARSRRLIGESSPLGQAEDAARFS
jgi:hypothetical protein